MVSAETDLQEEKNGRERLLTIFAVCISLFPIIYVSDVLGYLDIWVMRQRFLAIMLILFTGICFIRYPISKKIKKTGMPWYDTIFLIAAIIGPLYYAVFYPSQQARMDSSLFKPYELVLTIVSILVILEAGRRALGLTMPAVALFFFIHGVYCDHFPGFLQGRGYDLARVTTQAYLANFGVLGFALNVASTIVILFILFGTLLQKTGGGAFISDVALSLVGSIRGGAAKAAVLASAAFGSISGMTTANIATTGTFTIPLMKKIGYRPAFAAAVEAVASNGGQIIPPVMGAVAFIMADLMDINYYEIVFAAIIPAFLKFVCVFTMVDGEAVRHNLHGLPRSDLPSLKNTFRQGWEFLIPIIAIIIFIGVFFHSPQMAALESLGVIAIVVLFRKQSRKSILSLHNLIAVLRDAGIASIIPGVACACAGIIIGSLGLTGVGLRLSSVILDFAGGNLFLLLVLAAMASYLLGMGVGSIASYLMVAVLIAPALIQLGVPEMAAHFFVFYMSIAAFITPPVAIGVFVAAGIAGSSPWESAWIAVRLAILGYIVPFIFVYQPALLMQGPWLQIVTSTIFAFAGAVVLAWGVSGSISKSLNVWQRLMLCAAGLGFLIPSWKLTIAGALIVFMLFMYDKSLFLKRFSARLGSP